jgi:hypothetical protein
MNKYIENGALLTTWYQIRENATTVDRGLKDIEKLFGHKSPLRFNKIINFPIYGFDQATPSNNDEVGIEDITVEGDCVILPSTITPNPNDFFMINHLKMRGIFQVIDVQHDSMKVEGYYRIRYRLHSTSEEAIANLDKQSVEIYHTDMNAVGSNINPIIKADDFVLRKQIEQMVSKMIQSYKALFYNERHNCFLLYDDTIRLNIFDMCGNEFMAKHSIMNSPNSSKVVMLHEKLRDDNLPIYYNNSIYNWLELGAPKHMLQKFSYNMVESEYYPDSSFARWGDNDILIMQPLTPDHALKLNKTYSYFDEIQLEAFDGNILPSSEYEKLIYKFINNMNSLSIHDISLFTSSALLASIRHRDVFFYTPILIYIIRKILRMN